jgi:glucose-6-phosphate isomerase
MALTLDYTHLLAGAVGPEHGLTEADIDNHAGRTKRIHAELRARRDSGELGFYTLPQDKAGAEAIKVQARRVRENFDTFVVLGIGGSALGVTATQTALGHAYHNLLPREKRGAPRLFVPDNPDPELTADLLDALDLKTTCFNVITKSGSTSETMAHYLVIRDRLKKAVGPAKVKDHLVITTDPKKGVLRKIADAEGIPSLPVPPAVGGRFSVLCAVGLLPAAVMGHDIDAMLAGAGAMASRCDGDALWDNPAYLYSTAHHIFDKDRRKSMAVMMPYASALRDLADWYRQLLAESLGKRIDVDGKEVFCGQTPIKALGATDQHSQVQLYVEGPNDKVFTLVSVENWRRDMPIPADHMDEDALSFLGGRTMGELLTAEQRATEYALTKARRPNCTLVFPCVDAGHIGEFHMLFEIATAHGGGLYRVNAFDQPGVEEGKDATYALMGKRGFEKKREELEAAAAKEVRRRL